MPCPTADLKLALSSFLRVQFHGCHFALGVGAFLTPQCGFYKFHQPAPAPAAAVFKQQQNNKTPVVEEPAYYMLLLVKEWHLPPLLPAKVGPPQQAGGNRHAAIWLDGRAIQYVSGLRYRPCLYNGQSRPFQTCMKLASINTQMNTFN